MNDPKKMAEEIAKAKAVAVGSVAPAVAAYAVTPDGKTEAKPEGEAVLSPEDAKLQKMLSVIMKEVMGNSVPEMVVNTLTAMQMMQNTSQPQRMASTALAQRPTQKCQECGQLEAACNKEHVKMVVTFTKYPQYAEFFVGIYLNGVRYLSNHPGHYVTVPKAAEGEFMYRLQQAEEEEVVVHTKRTRHHNTGSIDRPNQLNPVTDGFR